MGFSNKPEGLDELDQVRLIRVKARVEFIRAVAIQEVSLASLSMATLET